MRVLVTGHQGYIGTVLTPLLMAAGHEVVGLDCDLYRRCTFVGSLPIVAQIEKDVRSVTMADLQGIDAVIHLAALSNDPLGNLNPQLTYEINFCASLQLARRAKAAGVSRFLFSSSCSTYGAAGNDFLNEEASLHPVTPYARSKVLTEQTLAQLADNDFSPIYLRNATAYGLSPRHRFDLVLNNLVAWAVATGRILLKSDGAAWRPLIHIQDIAQAFVAALSAPRHLVHNQAFNVGSTNENYRVREVAEIVKAIVPNTHIEYADDASPDKRSYRVDFNKITQALPGFSPRWNAIDGAEELYRCYRKANLQVTEFEGSRYRRVDHIQALLASGELDNNLRWTTEERES